VVLGATYMLRFARSLLFGYVAAFLYEGDSPLAERRAAALSIDPAMLAELLGRAELREVLDEALAQLRLQPPMADALRRVQLQVDALPVCEVDADLLRLVFVNLVGNALKFTAARDGAGHVTVGLRRTPQGAAVSVEDDGAGLPAGREAELFKPFVRLHGQDVPGSGVGLTIVRRIVEAHGGRVWAERADSGGARFLFTLRGLTA
jgi:signal transduction histidine kinase